MTITRIGADIDRQGKCCWSGKYFRAAKIDQIRKKIPQNAEIAIEACASAPYWSRALMRHGYLVKLIAPQCVKPYVKSDRNDGLLRRLSLMQ